MKLLLLSLITSSAIFGYGYIGYRVFSYCDDPDSENRLLIGAMFTIITLTLLIAGVAKFEKENPCLEYETGVVYNSELKMNQMVKYCVKRGKLVEE